MKPLNTQERSKLFWQFFFIVIFLGWVGALNFIDKTSVTLQASTSAPFFPLDFRFFYYFTS